MAIPANNAAKTTTILFHPACVPATPTQPNKVKNATMLLKVKYCEPSSASSSTTISIYPMTSVSPPEKERISWKANIAENTMAIAQ